MDVKSKGIEEKRYQSDKELYKDIIKALKAKNLDKAGDLFVKLKTEFENSPYLEKSAMSLAVAHMAKKENILANFYIQEALKSGTGQLSRYLLVRNQFESAAKIHSDHDYVKRAIETIQSNRALLSDADYLTLSDSMLLRLQLENIFNDIKVAQLYKKLKKEEAYKLYKQKASEIGLDSDILYKQILYK